MQAQRRKYRLTVFHDPGLIRRPSLMTINRYPEGWLDRQETLLADWRKRYPDANIYALIDGVHQESCYPLLKRSALLPFHALYANTPRADEETLSMSPILVQYAETERRTWDALLQKTGGRPMLSLIVTSESLSQLAQRLTPWCIVDADGFTLVLSFADTRVLPELFSTLTPHQRQQFCGPALLWQYVTRQAEWQALPLPLPLPGSSLPPPEDVILDARQCGHLTTAAEADNVLFQLRASTSNLVDCHTPAHAHELVCRWLACADHAQMEAAPDRVNLCEWGLAHPGLERHPEVIAWLDMPRRPQTLASLQTLLNSITTSL